MTIPNFKMTRFYVDNKEESEAVQKAMFTLGFKWNDERSGEKRTLRNYLDKGGYLYVNENCRIMQSSKHYVDPKYAAAFQQALFLAAVDHKLEKKALKKASKKRKQDKKAGWINWDTGSCPVAEGTLIDVKYRNGKSTSQKMALVPGEGTVASFWRKDNHENDIIAYRLSVPIKSKVISLQEVATKVAGWIPNTTGVCPVSPGTVVDVTYRDGVVKNGLKALKAAPGRDANERFWWLEDMGNDIVAYRLSAVKPATFIAEDWVEVSDVPETEAIVSQPETNPKRQYGLKSIPLNLWSPLASAYGAVGLYNGSLKYGKANFANTKVEASIYIAAAQRHLAAWASGEELDPADGVPNLAGVLANIAILLEARAAGMLIDDRLLMDGYLKERDTLADVVVALNKLHMGKEPKHYVKQVG